jgi:AraC-like DNA-binding protein
VGDTARLSQCFFLIREAYTGNFSGTLSYEGLELRFQIEKGDIPDQKKPGLLLAERIILMHNGEFHRNSQVCILILPWPSLTRQEASRQVPGPRDHALVISKNISPLEKDGFFDIPLVEEVEKAAELPGRTAFILWNTEDARFEELVKVAGLGHRSEFAEAAFLCYGKEFVGHTSLISAVENAIRFPKKKTILFIGYWEQWDSCWTELGEDIRIPSISVFNETIAEFTPTLIVFNSINAEDVSIVRQHPLTVMVPLIMISDRINSPGDITALNQYSRLLICHRAVSSSPEFLGKVKAIINGDEILPPHTGILVKKAIRYFDKHSESHISRRKLAEAVNVSEDYLTRIFHREMGLSLWDYLNRLRVFMAADLLRQTDRTIQDVALCTGFQDRAYFCRVFKKIYGQSPGQLRKKEPSHPEDLPHKRVLKH